MPEPLEPYSGWHCITIDEAANGWAVNCVPHGAVGEELTHLAAFRAALQHDVDNGTFNYGRGFE